MKTVLQETIKLSLEVMGIPGAKLNVMRQKNK